jgi:hypothetical protein
MVHLWLNSSLIDPDLALNQTNPPLTNCLRQHLLQLAMFCNHQLPTQSYYIGKGLKGGRFCNNTHISTTPSEPEKMTPFMLAIKGKRKIDVIENESKLEHKILSPDTSTPRYCTFPLIVEGSFLNSAHLVNPAQRQP